MSARSAARQWRDQPELARQYGAHLLAQSDVSRFVESYDGMGDPEEILEAAHESGLGIDEVDAGLLAVLGAGRPWGPHQIQVDPA